MAQTMMPLAAGSAEAWALMQHVRHFCRELQERVEVRDSEQPPIRLQNPLDDEQSRFSQLARTFALSPFERAVVMLCLVAEVEPVRFRQLAAAFHEQPESTVPGAVTGHLALSWFSDGDPRAFFPDASLQHWGIVHATAGPLGDGVSTRSLQLDPAILQFLYGEDRLNAQLARFVTPGVNGVHFAGAQHAQAEEAQRFLALDANHLIQLCGRDVDGQREFAQYVLEGTGRPVVHVALARFLALEDDIERHLMLWERETRLRELAVALDAHTADSDLNPERWTPSRVEGAVSALVDRLKAPVVLLTEEPLLLHGGRASSVVEVRKPSAVEQRDLWRAELGLTDGNDARLRHLTDQFNYTASKIRTVAQEARVEGVTPEERLERAWTSCRLLGRQAMGRLAERLDGQVGWDDLILPDEDLAVLRQLVSHVQYRSLVYETWGMGRLGRGLGISALFSGPSGTGKTLAAEVTAGALGLDLYRIDLSSMVSKYIGETEKNLKRIFDAADDGGAILLFDEADSLFGKRSDVKDSHDRYANLQVNYLLQRLESYAGLAILTTNLESAMDTAFMRRIRFVLNFKNPEEHERGRIWRRAFPDQVDVSALDFDKLARVKLAGGNIRSVALNAAFMAVARGEALSMKLIGEAIRGEWRKLGKLMFEDQTFADW